MPELFIELFSEEIPARLQARGADELRRLVGEGLSAITPTALRPVFGPRRIALAAEVAARVAATSSMERGPRVSAPEQALAGFLRKHGAVPGALREENGFWVLDRVSPAVEAASLIASAMPGLLRRFAWPKSMRWGGTSAFTWIRPLRRILCLLDGRVVAFALASEGDDGHGLASSDLTEGHRFHAPAPVAVAGFDNWQAALRARHVVPDAAERAALIREGVAALAQAHGLSVVDDPGLVDEVAGLVEWPVPLLGRIDDAFMDLPPEVMQVSMRVNQRYFALRTVDGAPSPWFAFAANIDAPDGGAAIVAGNERVLRARFADARHFWDLDRRVRLADRVAALEGVTFQAELGSQGARARRLVRLAGVIAPLVGADAGLAERAALLAKADLTTGMVGEFPELQGVMGGYYAQHDGEDLRVAAAIRDHYAPKGHSERIPADTVTICIALADRVDQLAGFFSFGHKPTGSGDPFALRRAGLGVIRLITKNGLRLQLLPLLTEACEPFSSEPFSTSCDIQSFIVERLRGQARAEGFRHDVLSAVLSAGTDSDLTNIMSRVEAVSNLVDTSDGRNLVAAYKRADNILRIENERDGPHDGSVNQSLFTTTAEQDLHAAIIVASNANELMKDGLFEEAIRRLAVLRSPLDSFFEQVIVNVDDSPLRRNRLKLLFSLRFLISRVANFSLIEA